LWLKRYDELGVRGIAEQSRRPHSSPRRTDAKLEQQVVQVRLRYPDWGARKLRVVLEREGVELPRNTIHRILLRRDLATIAVAISRLRLKANPHSRLHNLGERR
jgi:hypothetical protein